MRRAIPVPPLAGFPAPARDFLRLVTRVLDARLPPGTHALFIFGSLNTAARGAVQCSPRGTSDVDTLVVVDSTVPKQARVATWKALNTAERACFNDTARGSIIASILRCIERQTGMHENVFMCTERDVERVAFSRMFRTNALVSRFLAPTNIVIGSALARIRFLHGNPRFTTVLDRVQARIGTERHLLPDLLKSLVMNVALSLGAVVLLPFTARATRYAIEATKWSLYATLYVLHGTRPAKARQARFFSAVGIDRAHLATWLQLSKHYHRDTRFTVAAPLHVLRIHALGLRVKRLRAREKKA